MNANLKFSFLCLSQIRRTMVTVQLHERVWLFSLPIHPHDNIMTPFLLKDNNDGFDSNVHCVVIFCEKVYLPVWFGQFERSQCILRFFERVVNAIDYFLLVLESEALDYMQGLAEPVDDFPLWHQFLNLVDAFSESVQMGRRITKMLKKKMLQYQVDPEKLKGLIKEILHKYFLPHEIMLTTMKV